MSNVNPHLIDLTYEATLKSFWRKTSLRKFLADCSISPNFLATWPHEETKRSFLDRVFHKLRETEQGKATICKIAQYLADQVTFPDLKGWEDADKKISDAARAVEDLKCYLNRQNEEHTSIIEKEKRKNKIDQNHVKIRETNKGKQDLQEKLEKLYQNLGTQQAGYDFQLWFFDLLDHCEINNRRPYVSGGRQIDGLLTYEGTTYLVELKFTAQQANATDIDSLRSKVEDKADNTMGIMVSISGYSSTAIIGASGRRTTLMLMDYRHLYYFLTGGINFSDIVSRVRRHVSQTGEALLSPNDF